MDSLVKIDINKEDTYADQLQNAFDAATKYMKGRKSLRKDARGQKKFDHAMTTLAELSKAGKFALNAAEAVMDRSNEVRLKHDPDYTLRKLSEFYARTEDSYRINDDLEKESSVDRDAKSFQGQKYDPSLSKQEAYENTFI